MPRAKPASGQRKYVGGSPSSARRRMDVSEAFCFSKRTQESPSCNKDFYRASRLDMELHEHPWRTLCASVLHGRIKTPLACSWRPVKAHGVPASARTPPTSSAPDDAL
jgi:hypothetical protein